MPTTKSVRAHNTRRRRRFAIILLILYITRRRVRYYYGQYTHRVRCGKCREIVRFRSLVHRVRRGIKCEEKTGEKKSRRRTRVPFFPIARRAATHLFRTLPPPPRPFELLMLGRDHMWRGGDVSLAGLKREQCP